MTGDDGEWVDDPPGEQWKSGGAWGTSPAGRAVIQEFDNARHDAVSALRTVSGYLNLDANTAARLVADLDNLVGHVKAGQSAPGRPKGDGKGPWREMQFRIAERHKRRFLNLRDMEAIAALEIATFRVGSVHSVAKNLMTQYRNLRPGLPKGSARKS